MLVTSGGVSMGEKVQEHIIDHNQKQQHHCQHPYYSSLVFVQDQKLGLESLTASITGFVTCNTAIDKNCGGDLAGN